MLFLRALVSFLILPGTFAGVIPAWVVYLDRNRGDGSIIGVIPLAVGAVVLLWCVRDFYVAGKGTLAPWDPPRHLVTVGLYRYSRNPMYLGIVSLLTGWALLTGSPLLAGYTVVLTFAFHLRVLLYEEPRLANSFRDAWVEYARNVPRWIAPRISRPWILGLTSLTFLILGVLFFVFRQAFSLDLFYPLFFWVLSAVAAGAAAISARSWRGAVVFSVFSVFGIAIVLIVVPNFIPWRGDMRHNSIINNLRIIEAAKDQWGFEANKTEGDTPTVSDLTLYFKNNALPPLIAGETYVINPIGTPAYAITPVSLGSIPKGGKVTIP